MSDKNRGFTLLEVSIAIAIIGMFIAAMYKTPIIAMRGVKASNSYIREANFESKMDQIIRLELKKSSRPAYIDGNDLIINNTIFRNKDNRFIYIKDNSEGLIFTKRGSFSIDNNVLKIKIGDNVFYYETTFSSINKGGEHDER